MSDPEQPSSSPAEDDDHPPPACTVDILDASGKMEQSTLRWLAEQAPRVLTPLEAMGEVRVRIVRDDEMAEAHEKFAGVVGTTDVLTFDLSEPGSDSIDTDITVCVDEAERRAGELGHAVERELMLYIVHGVLHCLGHDDHDEDAYKVMHALEDKLLEQAGIGTTFYAGEGAP